MSATESLRQGQAGRCWLVDLGHSRMKWAERSAQGEIGRVCTGSAEELFEDALAVGVSEFVVAAVPPEAVIRQAFDDRFREAGARIRRVTLGAPTLPVEPAYDTLGVDRWLAFNAAWKRQPGALCVVDVGTATTIDVVDRIGQHCGGWILPGSESAREGLIARAPGLDRRREAAISVESPGRSTAQALERGLVVQQAGAIRLAIESADHHLGQPCHVVLTGGAAPTIQSLLEIDELQPDLVLHGLSLAMTRMDLES